MGRYGREDIIAYTLPNGNVVCDECMETGDFDNLKEEDIVTENDDEIVFCDRCKKNVTNNL